ncbi:MAG: HDOD domain-containing protein [Phycisphaerales bacterium]|nr:HDOD domain-containing protein [Phycisphaerales bacterium]
MKKRCELAAGEVPDLIEQLNRKLDGVGIETQPTVAMRLLELVSDPDAGLHDFAKAIRHDAALTGRLLRLSNSAFFAQRQPVTNIDRACVVLGRERLRACSLGFYLSRAATSDAGCVLSRQIWGQSVLRGCLAAELARTAVSAFTSEAFVVGLMLDAGIPIMLKLIGGEYQQMIDADPTPARLYAEEYSQFPFTHADVVTALMKRWDMPELLANPIAWHHVSPGQTHRDHAVFRMQRIAYYVGTVDLRAEDALARQQTPMPSLAFRVLGFSPDQLTSAVERASAEYQATIDIFTQVAEKLPSQESLSQRVHNELIAATEQLIVGSIMPPPVAETPSLAKFRLGGYDIEIETLSDGYAAMYLIDADGRRLISYRFLANEETPSTLRGVLGLEACQDDDVESIAGHLRKLAA